MLPRLFRRSGDRRSGEGGDRRSSVGGDSRTAPPMDQSPTTRRSRTQPRLDRRNAVKHIDYEASASASTSTSPDSGSGLRTRSLDLEPRYAGEMSFRVVGGVDGELDKICSHLGLSGPDDFSIPRAAWEARKARSSSDLFPRSRLREDSSEVVGSPRDSSVSDLKESDGTAGVSNEFVSEQRSRVSDALGVDSDASLNELVNYSLIGLPAENSTVSAAPNEKSGLPGSPDLNDKSRVLNGRANSRVSGDKPRVSGLHDETRKTGNRKFFWLADSIRNSMVSRSSEVIENSGVSGDNHGVSGPQDEIMRTGKPKSLSLEDGIVNSMVSRSLEVINNSKGLVENSRVSGIKGIRPPMLARPPTMSLPVVVDNFSSTWDIIRSLAPVEEEASPAVRGGGWESEEDVREEEKLEEERFGARVGETDLTTASCSFSTSNDDDSSSTSTTTEGMYVISPHGRFRRGIKSWIRGGLLGSGSFGTVYEGISE
ncbi:hypothetical protein AMTRI_Chr04g186900 [Amborella trichopoda]